MNTNTGRKAVVAPWPRTAAITTPVTLLIVMRLVEMRPASLLEIVWRPALGVLAMYHAVRFFVASAGEPGPTDLLIAIGIGAATYVVTIGGLWYLSGRPAGAERSVLNQVRRWIDSSLQRSA